MEQALRARELQLARHDLLPDLVSNTGYNGRDVFRGASSSRLLGRSSVGEQSRVASTSSERDVYASDLQLSWDVLDLACCMFAPSSAQTKFLSPQSVAAR